MSDSISPAKISEEIKIHEELKTVLLDKLKNVAEILFIGDPMQSTGSKINIQSLPNAELVKYAMKETPSSGGLCEVIDRFENGTLTVEEILTDDEIKAFQADSNNRTFQFTLEIIKDKLNIFAINKGGKFINPNTGGATKIPEEDDICDLILELIKRQTIALEDLKKLTWSGELVQIFIRISSSQSLPARNQYTLKSLAAVPAPVEKSQPADPVQPCAESSGKSVADISKARENAVIGRLPTLLDTSAPHKTRGDTMRVMKVSDAPPTPLIISDPFPNEGTVSNPPDSSFTCAPTDRPREKFRAIKQETTDQDLEKARTEIREIHSALIRKVLEKEEAEIAERRKEEELKKLRQKAEKEDREMEEIARKTAIEERCAKEGVKTLHLDDHEDPETCEIAYKGPVFILSDPDHVKSKHLSKKHAHAHNRSDDNHVFRDALTRKKKASKTSDYDPFLLFTYKLGSHVACFHELKELSGNISIRKQYKLRDFMAGLRYDPVEKQFTVKIIDPNVSLRRKDSDHFGAPLQSSFTFDEGDDVLLGRYHLRVERAHAFSEQSLYTEALDQIHEMIEVIFDTDSTTENMDLEAFSNIERILQCGLSDNNKNLLVHDCLMKFENHKRELWEKISGWNENNPRPDAKLFHPLLMTVKISSEGTSFLPKYELTMENLRGAAKYRAAAYFEAAANAAKNMPLLSRMSKKFPKLASFDKRAGVLLRKSEESGIISKFGAVEIARFIESGILEPDDLNINRTDPYYVKIQRLLGVRKLIDRLSMERGKQLEIISEVMKPENGHGLKMSDVYGEDEINIRNQDIDLNLKPELLICSDPGHNDYVSHLAKKIARKAWKKLDQKSGAEERKKELELLKSLIKMDIIHPIHLVDVVIGDDIEAKAAEIESQILRMDERIADSLRREDLENLKHKKTREAVEILLTTERKNLDEIFKKATRIATVLHQAESAIAVPKSFNLNNILGDLLDLTDDINDSGLELSIKQYLEKPIEEERSIDLSDYEGRMTRLTMTAQLPRLTWADINKTWGKLLISIAGLSVNDAIQTGHDAHYTRLLITSAVRKGLITFEEIGITAEKMEYGEKLEIYNKYEQKILQSGFDDFDFLDDPDSGIGRVRTAHKKLRLLVEKIRADDDSHYCKLIAKNVLNKLPELKDELSPEELALLQ